MTLTHRKGHWTITTPTGTHTVRAHNADWAIALLIRAGHLPNTARVAGQGRGRWEVVA